MNRYFWGICGISMGFLWFNYIDQINGLDAVLVAYSLTILPLIIAQLIKRNLHRQTQQRKDKGKAKKHVKTSSHVEKGSGRDLLHLVLRGYR